MVGFFIFLGGLGRKVLALFPGVSPIFLLLSPAWVLGMKDFCVLRLSPTSIFHYSFNLEVRWDEEVLAFFCLPFRDLRGTFVPWDERGLLWDEGLPALSPTSILLSHA